MTAKIALMRAAKICSMFSLEVASVKASSTYILAGSGTLLLKEYAQAEGVSARFGVDSESASDLSCGIGVSETVECWEKVQRTSARPHIDLVLGRNGTGTRLMCADT